MTEKFEVVRKEPGYDTIISLASNKEVRKYRVNGDIEREKRTAVSSEISYVNVLHKTRPRKDFDYDIKKALGGIKVVPVDGCLERKKKRKTKNTHDVRLKQGMKELLSGMKKMSVSKKQEDHSEEEEEEEESEYEEEKENVANKKTEVKKEKKEDTKKETQKKEEKKQETKKEVKSEKKEEKPALDQYSLSKQNIKLLKQLQMGEPAQFVAKQTPEGITIPRPVRYLCAMCDTLPKNFYLSNSEYDCNLFKFDDFALPEEEHAAFKVLAERENILLIGECSNGSVIGVDIVDKQSLTGDFTLLLIREDQDDAEEVLLSDFLKGCAVEEAEATQQE